MSKFQYGGMAVIEGVMMRGPKTTSIAVRKEDGTIVLEQETNTDLALQYPFLKWPFIRGTYMLIDSLIIGMRMLNKSANMSLDEDEEEISSLEMFISGVIAFVMAMLLFVIIPTAIIHYTSHYIGGVFIQNIIEGIIRIAFFLLYVYAISKMEDIARVFMYHGAEHKSISAYEAGEELNIQNVRKYPTLHPRCGTSFLLIVMVISILVFAMLGEGDLFYRIWSRMAVFPVIAGLGYEFLKFSGKYCATGWASFLIAPGLYLQKLTTREPDDSMLEVSIMALNAVLENEDNSKDNTSD